MWECVSYFKSGTVLILAIKILTSLFCFDSQNTIN